MESELPNANNTIEGHFDPGYESVKDMFEAGFIAGREYSAQLCVYVRDKMVINLWHSVNNTSYTNNTLTTIFSSSKNLSSLAMAILHDRGLLRYDARIVEYWPEFTGGGKEGITVADMLKHEAGYANFPMGVDSIDFLFSDNIKNNTIGKLYEESTPSYPKIGKREYHRLTRGFLANEIFRRIEPSGCTIGEFLKREISSKLDVRVFIGVPENELEDYEPVKSESVISSIRTAARSVTYLPYSRWPSFLVSVIWSKVSFKIGGKKVDFSTVNDDLVRRAEIPSVCANASAEGLAKLAAFMANKGKLGNEIIMSEKSWRTMHAGVTDSALLEDIFMTHLSQGGVNRYQSDDFAGCGRDGFWGWMGYGGSVFQWHPDYRIGFAYVPSLLEWSDLTNQRGGLLQEEVVRCVNRVLGMDNSELGN